MLCLFQFSYSKGKTAGKPSSIACIVYSLQLAINFNVSSLLQPAMLLNLRILTSTCSNAHASERFSERIRSISIGTVPEPFWNHSTSSSILEKNGTEQFSLHREGFQNPNWFRAASGNGYKMQELITHLQKNQGQNAPEQVMCDNAGGPYLPMTRQYPLAQPTADKEPI